MARSLVQILEHVDHFQHRVLQDALIEASSAYWERRASSFAKVGTPACDLIADNCRRHARILVELGLDDDVHDLIAHEVVA